MSYFSTRGGECVTASQAILLGLAPGGGLYVPAMFPQITRRKLAELTDMDYRQRAVTILRTYLEDFTPEAVVQIVCKAGEFGNQGPFRPAGGSGDVLAVDRLTQITAVA